MVGESVSFTFDLPHVAEIVRQVRADKVTLLSAGTKNDVADVTTDIRAAFRALPIVDAVLSPGRFAADTFATLFLNCRIFL